MPMSMIPLQSLSVTAEPANFALDKRLHAFRKGEFIGLLPEAIWQVQGGVVQLNSIKPEGMCTVLGWLQSQGFYGKFMTRLDAIQAIALTDCYLCRYSTGDVQSSTHLQREITSQSLQRLQQAEYLLAIAGLKRIEERLLALLSLLKKEMGQAQDTETRIRIRLTHQTLADTIGTTRVTVTRLLKTFQRQNWIRIDGDRHILICNHAFPDIFL